MERLSLDLLNHVMALGGACRHDRVHYRTVSRQFRDAAALSEPAPCGHELGTSCAAARGQLPLLKWLRAKGCPCDPETLAEGGCPCNQETAIAAAGGGHLPTLQWLMDQSTANSRRMYVDRCIGPAALHGHMDILRWLHADPWSMDAGNVRGNHACAEAARGGHLPALQFLRRKGHPWNSQTLAHAARRGDVPMLDWLEAEGCLRRGGIMATSVFEAAASGGHLATIQWFFGPRGASG